MDRVRFRRRFGALVGLAVLSVLSTAIGGTTASFTAATRNQVGPVSFDSLSAPTGLTASARGNNVDLAWTPGELESGGTGGGHRVQAYSVIEGDPRIGADPGGCSASGTFDQSIGRTAGATSTLTDATPVGSAGSWLCYRVQAEAPATPKTAAWFNLGASPIAFVQLEHVVRSIEAVDGGSPGELRPGDAFVFTYNQLVNTATGPQSTSGGTPPTAGNDICVHTTSGSIVVGRITGKLNVACAAANTHLAGKVATATMLPTKQTNAYQATYSWSSCDAGTPTLCRVLTATLGDRYLGTTDVSVDVSGADVTPNVISGATVTAEGTALCSTANNASHTCRPKVTGSL